MVGEGQELLGHPGIVGKSVMGPGACGGSEYEGGWSGGRRFA